MRDKTYRDNFVAAHLSTGIAAQLVTMRENRNWQQKNVAEKVGMAPARISVMENPSYDKFTLTTLKRLASAFDVALVVRFVPFHELVDWISDLSPTKLDAISFTDDRLPKQRSRQESSGATTHRHRRTARSGGAAAELDLPDEKIEFTFAPRGPDAVVASGLHGAMNQRRSLAAAV